MENLLIIGCGDIARRALPGLKPRFRVSALVRSRDSLLAASGIELIAGDLDRAESLASLANRVESFTHIAHLAPPDPAGAFDRRTRNLLAALEKNRAMLPHRIVYISTSGVYGDCGGERVDERRAPAPQTDRARRRLDAEHALAGWGERNGTEIAILRVPGIYAADRLPVERIRLGTPVLREQDDVYTNHIHADDLAAILATALDHPRAQGVFNACDDSEIKMGDWFDLVADRSGLPRPPRVPRAEAARLIPPELLSFMSESRRLINRRMKEELGVRLRYPTVVEGVPRSLAAVE